jgi:hypothetical protein
MINGTRSLFRGSFSTNFGQAGFEVVDNMGLTVYGSVKVKVNIFEYDQNDRFFNHLIFVLT